MRNLTLGFVPYGTGQHAPFDAVFPEAVQVTPKLIYDGAVDAIVIWGGCDISPSLYGEVPNTHTSATAELSHRDKVELDACTAAVNCGIPIIGVCRGAQLLCAISGGTLIQHVEGHHGDHLITTDEGRTIITSSVHHQMMFPWGVEHKLIAWATTKKSNVYLGEGNRKIHTQYNMLEPEIVYFPKLKGLAIQGHPEFMDKGCEFVNYCNDLVKQYLLQEEN